MRYMRRCLPFSRLAVVSFSGGIALTMVPAYKKAVFHAPKYGFPHCVVHFIRALGNFRGARIDFAKRGKTAPILIFCAQLFANFLWSVLFFGMHNPAAGLADSIVLLILAALYAKCAWNISKTASIIFVPYVLWCAFATILNLWIVFLN